MGGVLVFRKSVLAGRLLFRRETWVSGALLVFDDDVQFFTHRQHDWGGGTIGHFHWSEVVGIEARPGLVRGAVTIALRRGEQRFRCRGALRLAQQLKAVHAAWRGQPAAGATEPRQPAARVA